MKGIIILIILCFHSIFVHGQTDNKNCNSGSYNIVAPFLGEWEEYEITDSGEVYIGRLVAEINTGGCVLTQTFISPDSTFSYRSHGFVNPASNLWEEMYVFSAGGYAKYLWIVEGDSLYTLKVEASRKIDYIYRLRYTDIKEDEYLVVAEESFDGGKTWTSKELTRIKKIKK